LLAARDRAGEGVQAALNPNFKEERKRKTGPPAKNHHKEYRSSLAETQRKNREDAEAVAAAGKREPWKMSRFQNVQSVVAQNTREQSADPSAEAVARVEAQKERRQAIQQKRSRQPSAPHERKATSKPPVPKASELPVLPPRSEASTNVDYIRENARSVINAPAPVGEAAAAPGKHEDFGRVPQYLIDRKLEVAEQEAQQKRAAEEAQVPAGMRRMEEVERQRTLQLLQESARKIVQELGRFPLVIETQSKLRARQELEHKLAEVETAIKTFSKPVVYISD